MNQSVNYANRGMSFEMLLDATNRMYESMGQAIINKRPTPIRVTGRGKNGQVTGYFEKPSTVDYDGTLPGGRSIVFEAKSTHDTTKFPFNKLQDHQFDYLKKCHQQGAVAFLLIEFITHRTIYLLPFQTLKHYWDRREKGVRGTASISLSTIEVQGYLVKSGRVPVDYLPVVKQIWKLEVA